MTLPRITDLTEAPIIGEFYLVPTVRWNWYSRVDVYPVFLPLHNDKRFLSFEFDHYHIDPRFASERQSALAEWMFDYRRSPTSVMQSGPIARNRTDARWMHDPPEVTWKRRKCREDSVSYEHYDKQSIQNLHAAYAGQQCKHNRSGWVCPHQSAALGSMAVVDGVITCPLHGLRVRAEDGVVL